MEKLGEEVVISKGDYHLKTHSGEKSDKEDNNMLLKTIMYKPLSLVPIYA